MSRNSFTQTARFAATVALILLLPLLAWYTAASGYASRVSINGAKNNDLVALAQAMRLSPADAENQYLRAAVLEANGDIASAISVYTEAISLRPGDYVLWLSLARARELNGEMPGAIAAARQAVPLAPFYAQTHWQLGNLLVRAGQREEGFQELRVAGAANPNLLPGIVDLAWQLSGGDVQFVKQSIAPETPAAYKALAENFKKHEQAADAIAMLAAAGPESRAAREQYLRELISAKRFAEAYTLWLQGRPVNDKSGLGVIVDPSFEEESNLDEPGFGWRTENTSPSLSLSLDPDHPPAGRSSLRIEFKGESDPGQTIISQLVMIDPRAHYQLGFAARTESLVSGGLPNFAVTDANDNTVLGHAIALPQQTPGWQRCTIDFIPKAGTNTIQISLRRERCSNKPCPIFGRVWLDDFSLQVISR